LPLIHILKTQEDLKINKLMLHLKLLRGKKKQSKSNWQKERNNKNKFPNQQNGDQKCHTKNQ
jgi:hypothetical protein